jgi:hypothetical protein
MAEAIVKRKAFLAGKGSKTRLLGSRKCQFFSRKNKKILQNGIEKMTGMWYHILDKCGMTAQIWRKPKIRKEVKNVKKVLSMVLAVVMLASTLSLCFVSTFTASAEEVAAVSKGQVWEYLAWEKVLFSDSTATIPEGALVGTDAEEWKSGMAPFGEGRTTDFGWGNFASILRTTFNVGSTEGATVLKLFIKYDENPTVYINGTEVWALNQPGGYHDGSYVEIDLVDHLDKLVEGTNYFCIVWEESYGGSVMDAELITDAEIVFDSYIDANGYIKPIGATCEHVGIFGDINKAENAIDWNPNTVCGDGDAGNVINVFFNETYTLGEIFIRCKNEGRGPEEGAYGTYDIYAVKDGVPTKIAANVPAIPVADNFNAPVTEGVTVTLDAAYEADSIKVVVTSWDGPGWACVGDVAAKPAEEGSELPAPTTDCEGNPLLSSLDSKDFNATLLDVIDGVNGTCAATAPGNLGVGRIQVNFVNTTKISGLYIESKNEGMDQLPEGDRIAGYYDVYVVIDNAWNLVATNVPATPDGYEISFDKAYNADAVGVIPTAWKTSNWATISEVKFYGADEEAPVATTDLNGNVLKTGIDREGVANFGFGWNAHHFLFDNNYSTMVGSGFGGSMSFTVSFAETQWFDSIKTVAKAEGYGNLGENCFGKANYYVIQDGVEILVAEGVEVWAADAVTAANKAAEFVTFEATAGEAIKVVITEWNSEGWAGFAEMDYTTTDAPAEEEVKGDVNGTGVVDIDDVTDLLKFLAGTGELVGNGDLDGSGVVDITDVTDLLKVLAGN